MLRRHPVAGYILLTYGISYLIGFPFLLGFQSFAPAMPQVLRTYLSRLFVVFGPGLAALILATLQDDSRRPVRSLLGRLRPRTMDVVWLAGIVVVTALGSAAALVLSGVQSVKLYDVVQARFPLLLAHVLLQFLIVALGEEPGWRGWLLPALLTNYSRLQAALLVGVVWTLWHGPLLISSVTTTTMFAIGTTSLSVLFTWLWAHTGRRLFVVVFAHAVINAPLFFWEQAGPSTATGPAAILAAWYILEAIFAIAAALLVAGRWQWWISRCETSA